MSLPETLSEFLDRYQYDPAEDELGQGGFGTVYKAKDVHKNNKLVAVKIAKVSKKLGKFTLQNEVRLAREIPYHPNIASYFNEYRFTSETRETFDYAVSEYYEHGNLSEVLKNYSLTAADRQAIADGLLNGLKHLHNENVIHRDFKSPNILMARQEGKWIPKIADFGLGKLVDTDGSVSNSAIGLSYAYAAPEQVNPKRFLTDSEAKIRKNVDIWALGVILYELFVGNRPFRVAGPGYTDQASVNAELTRQIQALEYDRTELNHIPQPYRQMVEHCLVLDRAKRAQDVISLSELKPDNKEPKPNNDQTQPDNKEPKIDKDKTRLEEQKKQPPQAPPTKQKDVKDLIRRNLKWLGVAAVLLLLIGGYWGYGKYQDSRNRDWWNGLNGTWKKVFNKQIGTGWTTKNPTAKELRQIVNLDSLHCLSNYITSLEPLANLKNLTELDCGDNDITSLEPLANLKNLTELDCGDNDITSLQPLVNLKNLEKLDCSNSQIRSPVRPVNQITSLEPLANLTNLEKLYCQGNYITSLEPLANLTNLKEFDCSRNQITSLQPLANLTNLKALNCWGDKITSLQPLANLTNLTSLVCGGDKITSLQPLANLTNLKALNCWGDKITSLQPLANLTNLTSLVCGGDKITSLQPLANLTNLTSLVCGGDKITSLQPLANLTNLEKLHCSRSQITSLQPLANLKNLTELDCDFNKITSLEPLANLPNLEKLYCQGNDITSLEPLANLKNLTELDCDFNKITSLEPLANLKNLTELDCTHNQISTEEIQKFKQEHPDCSVSSYGQKN